LKGLDQIPLKSDFKGHLEIVMSFLKKIYSKRVIADSQHLSVNQSDAKKSCAVSHVLLFFDLHQYIVRSCLQKIATRASYHSNMKGGRATAKYDYARLLRPSTKWKAVHDKRVASLSDPHLQAKYKSTLALIFDSDTSGSFHEIDSWSDSQWDELTGFNNQQNIEKLRNYRPTEFEMTSVTYCSEEYGSPLLLDTKGAYLQPKARKAFHATVTALCTDSLLGLKLLSDLGTRVTDSIANTEVQELVNWTTQSMLYLKLISYNSPLLPVHLEWFLKSGSQSPIFYKKDLDGDVEMDMQDNLDAEENETSVDILDHRYNAIFGVACSYAKAIVRWLRLTTLHTHCVESLIHTSTISKLRKLEIRLITTPLPEEDPQMENLQSFLEARIPEIPAVEVTSLVKEIEKLARISRLPDEFKGSFHCEAILLSLYLLAKEGKDHVGVDDELKNWAGNLFPQLVAVTKACCPVCATLVDVVANELQIKIDFSGIHRDFTPCALPPWLPKRYAKKVADRLEPQLDEAINEKRLALEMQRRKDRGSQSPSNVDVVIDSCVVNCLEIVRKRRRIGKLYASIDSFVANRLFQCQLMARCEWNPGSKQGTKSPRRLPQTRTMH
jgi:hypothetical protein